MEEHQEIPGHSALLASLDARLTSLESNVVNSFSGNRDSQVKIHEIERRVDVMAEKLNRFDGEFASIQKELALITEKQETLKERVPTRDEWNSIKTSISSLTHAPGVKWERLMTVVLTAIVTGVISYVIVRVLPIITK